MVLFCIWSSSIAYAQNFKIQVSDENGGLASANVFLNYRNIGYADSDGIYRLNKSGIRDGDVLLASFLGKTSDTIVVTSHMLQSDECNIRMTSGMIHIDEVVVSIGVPVKHMREQFKMHVDQKFYYWPNHKIQGRFVLSTTSRDDVTKEIQGRITLDRNKRKRRDQSVIYSDASIETSDDTTGLMHCLDSQNWIMHYGILAAFAAVQQFEARVGSKTYIWEYHGLHDNLNVYSLNFNGSEDEGGPISCIYYIDNDSKLVISSKTEYALKDITTHSSSSAEFQVFKNNLILRDMECIWYNYSDNTTIKLRLIDLEPVD